MADGRSQALWSHTSAVLALLANVHRDPKKSKAFKPSDFNPHSQKHAGPLPKVKLSEVKGLLMGEAKAKRSPRR